MPVASMPLTAPGITPPGDYALPPDRYHALLAERATCVRPDLREDEGKVRVAAPPGAVIRLWNGATTTVRIGDGEETMLLLPPDGPPGGLSHGLSYASADSSGAAVFTRSGEWVATGEEG